MMRLTRVEVIECDCSCGPRLAQGVSTGSGNNHLPEKSWPRVVVADVVGPVLLEALCVITVVACYIVGWAAHGTSQSFLMAGRSLRSHSHLLSRVPDLPSLVSDLLSRLRAETVEHREELGP